MIQSDHFPQRLRQQWQRPIMRRGLAFGLALLALLVMAFYAVSDVAHLAEHGVLAGADWLGYAVCHRIPARSFTILERPLPLCARCTGMYLAVSLTLFFFWLGGRMRYTELPRWPLLLVLFGFMGVMGVDGVNSYLHLFPQAPHLYTPQNWLRLLTGMGTGLAMGSFIWPALAQVLWARVVRRPMLAGWRPLGMLLVLAGGLVLLVLSNQPPVLYVLAIVSTVGLVGLLAAINVVLGLVLLRQDGRERGAGGTAVVLLLGVLLAVVELSAISIVRYSLTGTMAGFPGL